MQLPRLRGKHRYYRAVTEWLPRGVDGVVETAHSQEWLCH